MKNRMTIITNGISYFEQFLEQNELIKTNVRVQVKVNTNKKKNKEKKCGTSHKQTGHCCSIALTNCNISYIESNARHSLFLFL